MPLIEAARRPRQVLEEVGRQYPGIWSVLETRADARNNPNLPPWCWVPAYVVTQQLIDAGSTREQAASLSSALTGLAGWRLTQGVYAFDPALYDAVIHTPMNRDVPADPLYRLPQWCVYIATPGLAYPSTPGITVRGAWLYLTPTDAADMLVAVLDLDGPNVPLVWPDFIASTMALPLTGDTLEQSLQQVKSSTLVRQTTQMYKLGESKVADLGTVARPQSAVDLWRPLLSLALFLCADDADLSPDGQRPANARVTRTKRGLRMFPAAAPRVWDVGTRMGAALRLAIGQAEQTGPIDEARAAVRPHIRAAHWHGYWTGKRTDPTARRFSVRWMPPILVNADSPDELATTVRPVRI